MPISELIASNSAGILTSPSRPAIPNARSTTTAGGMHILPSASVSYLLKARHGWQLSACSRQTMAALHTLVSCSACTACHKSHTRQSGKQVAQQIMHIGRCPASVSVLASVTCMFEIVDCLMSCLGINAGWCSSRPQSGAQSHCTGFCTRIYHAAAFLTLCQPELAVLHTPSTLSCSSLRLEVVASTYTQTA